MAACTKTDCVNYTPRPTEPAVVHINLPPKAHCFVIGKNGSTIKRLMKLFGCVMRIGKMGTLEVRLWPAELGKVVEITKYVSDFLLQKQTRILNDRFSATLVSSVLLPIRFVQAGIPRNYFVIRTHAEAYRPVFAPSDAVELSVLRHVETRWREGGSQNEQDNAAMHTQLYSNAAPAAPAQEAAREKPPNGKRGIFMSSEAHMGVVLKQLSLKRAVIEQPVTITISLGKQLFLFSKPPEEKSVHFTPATTKHLLSPPNSMKMVFLSIIHIDEYQKLVSFLYSNGYVILDDEASVWKIEYTEYMHDNILVMKQKTTEYASHEHPPPHAEAADTHRPGNEAPASSAKKRVRDRDVVTHPIMATLINPSANGLDIRMRTTTRYNRTTFGPHVVSILAEIDSGRDPGALAPAATAAGSANAPPAPVLTPDALARHNTQYKIKNAKPAAEFDAHAAAKTHDETASVGTVETAYTHGASVYSKHVRDEPTSAQQLRSRIKRRWKFHNKDSGISVVVIGTCTVDGTVAPDISECQYIEVDMHHAEWLAVRKHAKELSDQVVESTLGSVIAEAKRISAVLCSEFPPGTTS